MWPAAADEHAVGVRRVDRDAAERGAVRQAHVLPGRAVVGRLVDAVAEVGEAAAGRVGLAGAGPQRAVGRLGDRAHRLHVRVGPDRRPVRAAVRALPDAAAGRRAEDRVVAERDHVGHAPADVVRAELLPGDPGRRGRHGLGLRLLAADHVDRDLVARAALEVHHLVRRGLVGRGGQLGRLVLRWHEVDRRSRALRLDLRRGTRQREHRHCAGEQHRRNDHDHALLLGPSLGPHPAPPSIDPSTRVR